MTKSHGRKSRARNRSRRSGAAYAAANAGTLHVHASGPSATDLQPDPGRWGVETVPDLRTAAALIGASIERCAPCRQSLTAKLLEEDPIVLAVTAGAAYRLHAAARVPEEEGPVAGPAQAFSFLVEHDRAHGGDARPLLAAVERMPAADRAALLGDALDLFRAPAPAYGGGGEAAIAVSSDERGLIRTGPLPHHQLPAPLQPSKENRIPMSENTEDVIRHAESAARSLAEFVTDLQYRGRKIEHPAEASFIDSHLARAADEMTTALTLLRTFMEGLRNQDRLMTDYRGEPLGEVLQRYRDSSLAAEQLADALGKARPVTEHPAYEKVPGGEQGPAAAARSLAELVTGLKYRGIEYPVEAYRIFSFLTRVAGEMRAALTLLKASAGSLRDEERPREETLDEAIQWYTGASVTAGELAGVLGRAYSAVGHLAYREAASEQEPGVRG
ncbi:hypothetical protein ACFRIB_52530 [Streptomyces mirabilis]|uniref:hypothetical protein n=1 Tax=Streptomyces mirabilis TaxID=68239 RepID=UPI0036BC4BCC